MPEPSLDDLIAQIQQGIEDHQFAGAREIFNATVKRWGASPTLTRLRRGLERAEQEAHRPRVAQFEQEAQQQLTRGNYGSAVDALRQACALLPHDGDLRLALTQAERALNRHQAALAREREVGQQAQQIEALIEAERLEEARAALREAHLSSGRHRAFERLEDRLRKLERQRLRQRATRRLGRARELLADSDWHGAMAELDRALAEDPQLSEAAQLRQQARSSLELEQGRHFTAQAIDEARRDVERLLAGRELRSADQRLSEAVSLLGRHQVFSQLGRRIDEVKAGVQAVRRREWAERRQREAAAKIGEADRLLRGSRYQEALQCLQTAESIEPELAGLKAKLSTVSAALERQLQSQQQVQPVPATPPRPQPASVRQQLPGFGRRGLQALSALAGALVASELLGWIEQLEPLAKALRFGLLLIALAAQLAIARHSAEVVDDLPEWRSLTRLRPRLLDLATVLGLAAVCLAPLGLFVWWRGAAGLLGNSASLISWLLVVLLAWLGLAAGVVAGTAAAGYGRSRATYFHRHARAWVLAEVDSHQLVTGLAGTLTIALLARALLGLPGQLLAAILEAGMLLGVPLLAGRMLRHWRSREPALYG